ncbi:30S ribosomal protein S21 [Raphidocelis subcapitata]|uniref:30S ribosomal protein S21 n=1 Tax=Raphidocelis subcapitata TaxID=307507 RepID=A0A2V0PRS7_9CHLO|nr:30S ribosomal protein S21 [Raphidocelis subcapitata]|eukprot:GBF99995.1 30S ribosomal protein S21 [Raphidocelis subcapitata]
MASLTTSRALAGLRAFAPASSRPTTAKTRGPAPLLARRDSFMVEVEIAEEEPEDVAVRRYMKAVMQSGVINKLRSLRHKESKIETYKRKLQERARARKLDIVDPTWEEFYGDNSLFDNGMPPFDDFFRSPEDDLDVFDNNSMPILEALDYNGMNFESSTWGYQGGYQPSSAYGGQQQQQQGQQQQQQGQAGGWQQPPAQPGQPGPDVFDLQAYEQQKGGGSGGAGY